MTPATTRPAWLTPDRFVPVIVMFFGLFVVTYIFDAAFDRMGVNPASTLFNNFSIGYFGAAIILYYQIRAYREEKFSRAKEKEEIIAEVNQYVRGEFSAIVSSAALEDRDERLKRIEEAMSRIEARLANSAPAEALLKTAASSAARD